MTTRQTPLQPLTTVEKTSSHLAHTQPPPKTKNKKTLIPVRSCRQDKPHLPKFRNREQQLPTAGGHFTDPLSDALDAPTQTARTAKSAVSSEQEEDSVLAKYIERFRHGQPQSREERQHMSSAIGEESPLKKNTQNDEHITNVMNPAGCRDDRTPSPCRESASILSDMSQSDFEDTEILHLQERASRLLQRSDGISSEGLGCSDLSSPPRVEEQKQPFVPTFLKSASAPAKTFQKSISTPPSRPEEDILFQWRLKRRMEQAVELSQPQPHSGLHVPACGWPSTSMHQSSADGQACKQSFHPPDPAPRLSHSHAATAHPDAKEAHGPGPPPSGLPSHTILGVSNSSAPQLWSLPHVPMHTHLLCDVLPCPMRSSYASTEQSVSRTREGSLTRVAPEKKHILVSSKATSTDEFICKRSPSPPSEGDEPGRDEIYQRDKKRNSQTRDLEKTKKTAGSTRRQKKPTSVHADGPTRTNKSPSPQRVPKKGMPCTVQQQLERRREFSSASEQAGRTSTIRSTLGQVVSEVLFPTSDSPPAQRTPASSIPSRCTSVPAPPQPSLPPLNTPNSMEVISQLLQEAEDSDEKEFEDDPLLKVLRKQRKCVKDQIREVDSMLEKFPDEQQVN